MELVCGSTCLNPVCSMQSHSPPHDILSSIDLAGNQADADGFSQTIDL